MSPKERSELLDCYLELSDSFGPRGPFGDITALDPELLAWRPFPEAWTIHEQVVHVFEGDVASFHRYRKAIAEPGGLVIAYDEEVWTKNLAYSCMDLGDAIRGFQTLRELSYRHLKSLLDQDWSQWWFSHNIKGKVDLETWLGMYVDHVLDHHEYIRRNIDTWRESRGSKKP